MAAMEWFFVVAVALYVLWRISRRRRHRRAVAATNRVQNKRVEPRLKGTAAAPQQAPGAYTPASESKGRRDETARPPRSAQLRAARWIGPGETVEAGGVQISGGLVYVGSYLATVDGRGQENCLIDPALSVASRASDKAGETLPYWPAYGAIRPEARRAYLDWLAGTRSDPEIGIGYVFLYFYGLERRVFIDRPTNEEVEAIMREVRRLREVYGSNGSFSRYSGLFLDVAQLVAEQWPPLPAPSPDLGRDFDLPLSIKLHVGQALAEGQTLDAELCLLWVLSSPDTSLRTPALRCFDEFRALWRVRFDDSYPQGLKVRPPKARIRLRYRAASGGFEIAIEGPHSNLPDISASSAPLKGLQDLISICTDELDAYSRLLGRKPETRGTIEAAVLLPFSLSEGDFTAAIQAAAERLEGLFDGRATTLLKASQLFTAVGLPCPADSKIPAAAMNQIGALLDRLDAAFEPDRRYGGGSLEADDCVVIFKAADGAPIDHNRPDYAAARTMVEVAALAALSDGTPGISEFDSLRRDLDSFEGLSQMERTRLVAYALALFRDPPKQQSILRRLGELSSSERQTIAQSAILAVLADGRVTPEEVRFIERLHKALRLPQGDVYAALHRGAVNVDDPVVVATEERRPGLSIPQEDSADNQIIVDEARLARIRSETQAVSIILAEIFDEEVGDEGQYPEGGLAAVTSPAGGVIEASFPGLDAPHGSLLDVLLREGRMHRESFEETAQAVRLLPEGAIETINDWSFERFGEALIEDDQVIILAEHLVVGLRELRPELP